MQTGEISFEGCPIKCIVTINDDDICIDIQDTSDVEDRLWKEILRRALGHNIHAIVNAMNTAIRPYVFLKYRKDIESHIMEMLHLN